MPSTLHVFDFLESADAPPAVCVAFGDEPFLKQLALENLRHCILGEEEAPIAKFEGDGAQWRDVADELSTMALFGGGARRIVLVEAADKFVSQHREKLEAYVARPRPHSVLVLEVGTWASNTRLYKALHKSGLQIDCRAPEKTVGRHKVFDEQRVKKWLVDRAAARHDARLDRPAADLLLELVGPEFGLLDQDLAKLALFAGPGGKITAAMVTDIVGGWRTKTIWELLDAAADGDAGEALTQLDRLLEAGEHPVALFGQIAWSLRRFAAAARIHDQAERRQERLSLPDALIAAGIPHWNRRGLERAESQLKQLGRQRAGRLYQWLLEADLAIKGTHSSPHRARFVLERLFVRMAKTLGRTPARR